jgi:hypothetical protein
MLDNEQKLELMKEAYRNNYKGSFTQLFMENDPEGNDPELMMPAPAEPTSTVNPPSLLSPRSESPENFQPESQKLVQSYKTAAPEDMPMGDAVKDVVQEPLEYNTGGYRLSEYTEIPYDSTANSSSYIKNYTSNYYKDGGIKETDHEKDGTVVVVPDIEKMKDTPMQKALKEGVLQKGYTTEVKPGEENPVDTKYDEGMKQIVESTGADFSDVGGHVSSVLRDVKNYRDGLRRQQSNTIYTNPDGSQVDWKDIYGYERPSYYVGERILNKLKEEGDYEFTKNVSNAIDKLDTLSNDDYDGFLKMANNIASKFNVENTTKENLKILMKLDTKEIKKYRQKMGLSKQDLLDLVVAPPGTSSVVQSLLNATKKTFGLVKDFRMGGRKKLRKIK